MALNFLNYVFTPSIMSHVFRLGNGIKMIVGNGDWGKLKIKNKNIYIVMKMKFIFMLNLSLSLCFVLDHLDQI